MPELRHRADRSIQGTRPLPIARPDLLKHYVAPVQMDFGMLAEAACNSSVPDAFFPTTQIGFREVRRVCVECPIRHECFKWGVAMRAEWVWGGRYLRGGRPAEDRLRTPVNATP